MFMVDKWVYRNVNWRALYLLAHDEFPRGDGHRAHDEHAAEERGLDELAQELGDAPAAELSLLWWLFLL